MLAHVRSKERPFRFDQEQTFKLFLLTIYADKFLYIFLMPFYWNNNGSFLERLDNRRFLDSEECEIRWENVNCVRNREKISLDSLDYDKKIKRIIALLLKICSETNAFLPVLPRNNIYWALWLRPCFYIGISKFLKSSIYNFSEGNGPIQWLLV